ncbi:MAG: galactose oxidase-like domain-containing protein, partial [Limnobacter sp.]|nr:galactose oxidase-like domain-containing protein [Limnobacter sp.]
MKSPAALESLVTTLSSQTNPELAMQKAVGGGMRGSTFSVQLPLRPNEDGDYTDASFLTAGGVLPYGTAGSPGGYFAVASSRIDTVKTELGDTVADGAVVGYESEVVGALNETRWYGTGVLLPDDSVIVFSGGDRDGVSAPGVEFPRKTAERFDPRTKTWTQMAEANQPRTYHNTALLMPDGRVLVGGHAPISTLYINNIDLSMFGVSPNDGRDPSFEIFTPPYVFNPNRPVLEAILNPQETDSETGKPIMHQFQPGETVRLRMGAEAKKGNIDSVTLVRHTAMTHLIDGDQRSIVIPQEDLSVDGNVVSFDIPEQATVIPEGAYMMFVRTKQADDSLLPSESLSAMIKHGS